MLSPGTVAPDFVLVGDHGREVSLKELLKTPLVLYFYPKDETPGCTVEACTFRDHYEEFSSRGALVVGISQDDPESHRRFKTRFRLPFLLLSDPGGKVASLYDVPSFLGLIPGRVTYIISPDGIIRYSFSSQFRPREHVKKALSLLPTLTPPSS